MFGPHAPSRCCHDAQTGQPTPISGSYRGVNIGVATGDMSPKVRNVSTTGSLFQTAEKRKRDEPGVEKDAVEMPPTQIGRALRGLG